LAPVFKVIPIMKFLHPVGLSFNANEATALLHWAALNDGEFPYNRTSILVNRYIKEGAVCGHVLPDLEIQRP